MNKDVVCPICGSVEKGINLEETNGWFICSKCNNWTIVKRIDTV